MLQRSPRAVRESRHQAAHSYASGNQIAKREEGLNFFDGQRRKFGLKFGAVADKHNPGNGHIRARERPGRGKRPIGSFGAKRLIMEVPVDKSRPAREPPLDQENFSFSPPRPASLRN